MKWSEFIAGLKRAGVLLCDLSHGEDGLPGTYLLREVDGELFWYPLPKHASGDDYVGAWTVDRAARRLQIDLLEWFPDWAFIL